jgi:hypothetical protein
MYILFVIWSYADSAIFDENTMFKKDYASPKSIYDNTHLNHFGAFMIWLLLFLLNPIFYISYFIYWLITVGR